MITPLTSTVWLRATIARGVDDDRWIARGVYATEKDAADACTSDDDFIAEVEVGKPFPVYAIDAIKMYYPYLEEWETSVLYLMRQAQHQPPKPGERPQLRLIKDDKHE